ncbi:retrotransposon gag protein [Cucumis melo var. makuwa]|uniref:Retrotransposon gag protein n=1 Tax=Cucumis melo var. makuwa TaxID=1194695 RepID=A0A5D3E320_CUCMM|nr:retrotransposon gag protein [Cucumis melo var. makuwa]TYK30188.1 retrotransposon gag protein [Cucumis melo var. makuwa]
MCIQGTYAHDMELSITGRGAKDFSVPKVRKNKKETKGAKKILKSSVKESTVVNSTPLKFSKRKEVKVENKDARNMLEQLLEKQLIQLSECKRPEQAGKVDDPNYCKYLWVISHPIEKCFVLKELILRLAREKKTKIDLVEVTQTNHAALTIMLEAHSSRLIFEQRKSLVQFETFELIVFQFYQEVAPEDSQGKERSIEEDDDGWIVVTRRKKRKSTRVAKE